ncbi:MAG: putative oxidoreductase [Chloroflexota bacterium]|jgi:putative oxidoreductase|nr:putative oxidoreductase [Chloroflexota bacterium]
MDFGLLVLRVVVGLVVAAHGSQKAFGWFGGGGMKGTTAMTVRLGFRPAPAWALMVIAGELGGGLFMALGLLDPLGPLGVAATMVVAALTVHRTKGFWASKGGYEFPLTLLAVAVGAALMGAGRYSLDGALGVRLPQALDGALVAVTALVLLAGFLTRRPAPAPQPATT